MGELRHPLAPSLIMLPVAQLRLTEIALAEQIPDRMPLKILQRDRWCSMEHSQEEAARMRIAA